MENFSRSTSQLPIIVTGATGFVGRHFLNRAAYRNAAVLPVIRSSLKAEELGLEKWIMFEDLTSRKLFEMGAGSATIVHLIGASREEKNCSMWDAIVKTTERLVPIAREAKVKRIVYLSGYGVTRESTETYFRAKAEAESIIESCGIPYAIFRCSYVLGQGDELTPLLVEKIRKGQVEIPGDGSYVIQPIYIEDLAEVLLRAVSHEGVDSYSYDLLGHPISFERFVGLLASRIAPAATVKRVSLETFIRRAIFSSDPEFTLSELAVLVCDQVGPVTESCLGVKIRSIEETLPYWLPKS